MLITRLYTVLLKPRDPRPYESAVFIADGYSITAFIFTWMWAIYHRMWLAALIFLILTQGVIYIGHFVNLSWYSHLVLQLGINFMIGISANELRRDSLERRGWVVSDVVIADSFLEAARRYFDRHFVRQDDLFRPVSLTA